jgi:hypothetical protein
MAWARKLLGDIAMLDDRPQDARRELSAALAVLDRHRCPTIEWRVLQSAAAAAAAIEGDAARDELRARAAAVVRSLADSIRNPQLRTTFLGSKQIRDLLQGARG